MTIANVTFTSGAEFPRDTTKVFQLSSNEPSSKHAQVSSSRERPTTDNYVIIPSKSFRCSTIDWPSLSLNSLVSASRKCFLVSYMFSKFFQRVWGSVSLVIWLWKLMSTHWRMAPNVFFFNFFSHHLTCHLTWHYLPQ